ncbi:Acetylcholinesterase [Strongyloides ratti]|uniref:Carboxylic ester hydrolase n=1 Tax=Strongyloides ratti TaxID=34506 RepID=A0A090LAX3_STRRB|nr:Acetylcholinesterase [Strongyloides ratti]CEF64665.1 Acetylcholinesterase [Strongyloides ratti]
MEKWLLTYLIATFFCLIFGGKDPKNVVKTKYGVVKGISYNYFDNVVNEYLGIPFAQPPVGKLRFKPPKSLKKPAWKGTFMANKLANSCAAEVIATGFEGYDFWNPTNKVSEDCLQLNMWVPKEKTGAVIVYIYGGAFYSGSASLDVYNGSVLAAKTKTIVVNLNYRLGVLGFGYLEGSKDIPGNMGLLDQQMGLKWVYENIENFGGDRKKITIWGESAGSVSVNAHLYAPDSAKYFQRVLSNSGIVDNVWGKYSNKYVSYATREVAKKLKCKSGNKNIVNCLIKAKVNDIIKAGSEVQASSQTIFHFVFSPIEKDSLFFKGNVTQKIDKHQMKKDVDLFIGKTSNEFTYFLPSYFSDEKTFGCGYDIKYKASSQKNSCDMKKIHYNKVIDIVSSQLKLPPNITKKLSKMYRKCGRKYRDSAARFLGEVYFDCDILKYIINISGIINGRIYYYEFKVVSSANPWPKWMGAMHGYELEYEFGMPFRKPEVYEKRKIKKEKKFSEHFMKLISNFAKSGIPSTKWKEFTSNKQVGALLVHQLSYRSIRHKKKLLTKTCKILSPYIPRRII